MIAFGIPNFCTQHDNNPFRLVICEYFCADIGEAGHDPRKIEGYVIGVEDDIICKEDDKVGLLNRMIERIYWKLEYGGEPIPSYTTPLPCWAVD